MKALLLLLLIPLNTYAISGWKNLPTAGSSYDHSNLESHISSSTSEHIDWTNATDNFLTTGTLSAASSSFTGGMDFLMPGDDNIVINASSTPRTVTQGVMRFLQRPSIPGTRVLNFEIDANSQNDTMALLTNYRATGMTTGDAGMNVEFNVDTNGSTGGTLGGLRVSKTGAGLVEVHAVETDQGVGVVRQQTGAFGNIEQGFEDSGGFVDTTAAFNSAGTNVELYSADNDVVYIGDAAIFNSLEVVLALVSSKNITAVFEYSLGGSSWAIFGPNDNTNGFTTNGIISWDAGNLTSWATDTVNGVASKYWVRITRTRNGAFTYPIEDTIQISLSQGYNWTAGGDIKVRSASTSGAAGVNTVFNDGSFDSDFRVEADGNANMLFIRASDGAIGINNGAPTAGTRLDVTGTVKTSIHRSGDGSAAVPSHSFFNNTNTGMYRITTSTLGFTTGGAERVRIDSGGLIGVGTTAPGTIASFDTSAVSKVVNLVDDTGSARLVAQGAAGASIDLVDTGGAANDKWMFFDVDTGIATFNSVTDNGLAFVNQNIVTMDMSTGNVGIGRASASTTLEVVGDIYSSSTTAHLIMKSPDGSCSSCGPDNSDVWACTGITCP